LLSGTNINETDYTTRQGKYSIVKNKPDTTIPSFAVFSGGRMT